MPLEDEDYAHLMTAEGYIALGKYLDADAELDEIDPDVRHLPEVLKLRLDIYQALEKWELMKSSRGGSSTMTRRMCARRSFGQPPHAAPTASRRPGCRCIAAKE